MGPNPRLNVLLVEDDAADVALVEDVFASRALPGHLHVVPDGVEALAFLRRTDGYTEAPRPDLIMLDLNMPRMDGREVLAIVKGDPHLRLIPIVVFTTSRQDEDVVASYGARANAYVTKPLELENFEEAVEQIHRFYGELVVRPT